MGVVSSSHKKSLKVFQLVMINVIAVDSIRTLSFSAVYGFSLVFFYLLMGLFFFLPTALVSAELGTGWPSRGGLYVWVREAFGRRLSFAVIWLNWLYNVIWYPTILALMAGTFAYLFDPELANNKLYMGLSVLLLFWAVTGINCLGMKASSFLSTLGALLGTILPMLFIGCLGVVWLFQERPMQIEFTWAEFFPHNGAGEDNLAFLTSVLFGLMGLEMAATHAREMHNPMRDYPKSLFISLIIILVTIVMGSLAIALVVPSQDLSLATGVIQAFQIFVNAYGLPWLLPVIAAAICLGGLSCVGAWVIGPAKGLLVASEDGALPSYFTRTNKQGVPVRILIAQAILVSSLCLSFILMPTVNSSYWILSVITAQLALLVYMGLFAAALRLHHRKPHVGRSFRIPGGRLGVHLVCFSGLCICFSVILIGFIPPAQIPFSNTFLYEATLILGIVIACSVPFLLGRKR